MGECRDIDECFLRTHACVLTDGQVKVSKSLDESVDGSRGRVREYLVHFKPQERLSEYPWVVRMSMFIWL